MQNVQDILAPQPRPSWQDNTTAFTFGLAVGAAIGAIGMLVVVAMLAAAS